MHAFVARAGHRRTTGTEFASLGVCLRVCVCEQVVAAYFSLVHPLPPPTPPPCPACSRGLPFFCRGRGVKGRARKRLLAQSQRHSGIPLQAKLEPTWPLPGDQWAAMLFKYKVTTGKEGFFWGGVTTAALLTEDTPLQKKKSLFLISPQMTSLITESFSARGSLLTSY